MPYYSFRNKETQEEFEDFFTTNTAKETWMEQNPHIEQIISAAPNINTSGRPMSLKPSDGFRDRLREIKKHHPLGNINTF